MFELSHRFGGWTAIALFWALTVHSPRGAATPRWHVELARLGARAPDRERRLAVAAAAARAVTVERPSAHAAIVHFDYGVTPAFASAVGISRSPLREWHAFATVTTPGPVRLPAARSRAPATGPAASSTIRRRTSGCAARRSSAPMAKVAVLYERVVYVVTGSGIGPCLGQILAARVPARLVWSTRDPRATYGDALVDEVEAAQPDAVIWDTTQRGKPDLVQLALEAYRDFDAEAVFVVSNKAATLRLVHAFERRGIPAFGPIWDS